MKNSASKLLIATTNQAKLAEYKEFLGDLPLELVSLSDLSISQQAPEEGTTFLENAQSKALYYSKLAFLPALADDGGFEIDYLKGQPGVKSHRWIHSDREDTDAEIIDYAIQKMENVPLKNRAAQMHIVVALAVQGKIMATEEAITRGIIAETPSAKRETGFPYRALLYFPTLKKYYGELTPQEMQEYNHRKRATERLKPIIEKYVIHGF